MKTLEQLKQQFETFYFINVFDNEVAQDRVLKDIEQQEDEELKTNNAAGWLWEQLEFAKLITIHRWLNSKKGWYQDRYYDMITNTENRRDVEKDEAGVIDNIGISMTTEEFELYKQLYNTLDLKWKT